MTYDELQDIIKNNIRTIIKDRFSNKKEFAKFVGIDRATIYQAVDTPSKRDFNLNHLYLMSRSLNIPLYNLVFSEALIPGSTVDEMMDKAHEFKEKFQMVPEIEPIACGNLSNISANNIIDYKVFNKPYMKETFKPFITRASGDSMEPTIQQGDLVLFDRNPDRLIKPTDAHIYIINTTPFSEDISLTIKRVIVKEKDIWLIPDNTQYRAEIIEMDEKSSPLQYVLGVAIWIGKELKKG
ncbi:MAG: S24 family peptidase [Candidatus Aminicenantes bacterium]|nr:S24 family peptidase [Candidatus Aminicenantes bacterium]